MKRSTQNDEARKTRCLTCPLCPVRRLSRGCVGHGCHNDLSSVVSRREQTLLTPCTHITRTREIMLVPMWQIKTPRNMRQTKTQQIYMAKQYEPSIIGNALNTNNNITVSFRQVTILHHLYPRDNKLGMLVNRNGCLEIHHQGWGEAATKETIRYRVFASTKVFL